MAVMIDRIEATVEPDEQPAPPGEGTAGPPKAPPLQTLRTTLAQLAQREARLRAD